MGEKVRRPGQSSADFFCKGSGSKYFRFCGQMVSVATIHFCYCSSNASEIIQKQEWLGPPPTTNLLTKTGSEPYLACRPCCRSRQAL